MAIRVEMRALLLGFASTTALLGEVDARELVRHAVPADERNWRVARNYAFWERVDLRRLDSQGRLKSKDVKICDVTLLEGSPYRRLAGRNDHPLPPGEEKKESKVFPGLTPDDWSTDCWIDTLTTFRILKSAGRTT